MLERERESACKSASRRHGLLLNKDMFFDEDEKISIPEIGMSTCMCLGAHCSRKWNDGWMHSHPCIPKLNIGEVPDVPENERAKKKKSIANTGVR